MSIRRDLAALAFIFLVTLIVVGVPLFAVLWLWVQPK